MKKILTLFLASTVFLGACNADDNEVAEDETEEVTTADETDETGMEADDADNEMDDTGQETEETDDETDTDFEEDTEADETEELEYDDLDEETQAELDQDWENIDWENVRLTRSQFDAVLYEVQDNLNVQTGEGDEQTVYIDNIDFDGETIEITLVNTDTSEFAGFATGMYAWVIDSFYRQLYLSSDYSNWEVQPRIIIMDEEGEVITDETEFITFEEE